MRTAIQLVIGWLVWSVYCWNVRADIALDDLMYADPAHNRPRWESRVSSDVRALLATALRQPDVETRRMAAESLGMAVQYGLRNTEELVPRLKDLLANDDEVLVRRAAARTLLLLERRELVDELRRVAERDGTLSRQIIEPVLADWNDKTMQDSWLERINDPAAERANVILAFNGLAKTRDVRATKTLLKIVHQPEAFPEVRLAAARAAGMIDHEGLCDEAHRLLAQESKPAHFGAVLAVQLIVNHRTEQAIEQLKEMTQHAEPAVATPAFRRLFDINPDLAMPFVDLGQASPDAGMRTVAARVLINRGNVDAVKRLARVLADRNPELRRLVADNFVVFGRTAELQSVVIEKTVEVLKGKVWQGKEQAALVLGALDHKPAAPSFLELLTDSRPEVGVAAAWALKKVRVRETLAPLLLYSQTTHEMMTSGKSLRQHGPQLSQIFQLFALERFHESEPLLKKFVPKSGLDPDARAAACYAIGYFHEGKPDEQLSTAFAQRLADISSIPPETSQVRFASAIALGRMKSESQLPTLRIFSKEGMSTSPGFASFWAIERIVGEPIPEPTTTYSDVFGWFVTPMGK